MKELRLLTLRNGKTVWFDGDSITGEEGIKIAQRLFNMFGLHGPRISRKLMYEVEPAIFTECPYTESEEDAVELSKFEDKLDMNKVKE